MPLWRWFWDDWFWVSAAWIGPAVIVGVMTGGLIAELTPDRSRLSKDHTPSKSEKTPGDVRRGGDPGSDNSVG